MFQQYSSKILSSVQIEEIRVYSEITMDQMTQIRINMERDLYEQHKLFRLENNWKQMVTAQKTIEDMKQEIKAYQQDDLEKQNEIDMLR